MARSANLKKILDRLDEQLAGKENTLITDPAEEKVRVRQQIAELRGIMYDYEKEYQGMTTCWYDR